MTIEEMTIKNEIFKLENLLKRHPKKDYIYMQQIKALQIQLDKFGKKNE
jgi:hypothetical protein